MNETMGRSADPAAGAAAETERIWSEFGATLRAFVARRVEGQANIDDLLQEVFLRIHQRAGSVRHDDRLLPWLFQVTRNVVADHYRAAGQRAVASGFAAGLGAEPVGADPHTANTDQSARAARRELAACLRPIVEQLAPRYREAVHLVDLQGSTQVAAAAQLGLSVSGVKSRVQRGRRALARSLRECCTIDLDAGGRVKGFEQKGGRCLPCPEGCEREPTP